MKYILLAVLCTIAMALVGCTTPNAVEEQTENSNQDYFLISLPKEIWQSRFPDLEGEVNIFRTNQDGSIFQPVVTGLNGHNWILHLSPNGEKMLVASYALKAHDLTVLGSLYVMDVDGSSAVQLSDNLPLYPGGITNGTLWLSDSEIAFISQEEEYTQIRTINDDGSDEVKRPYLNRLSLHTPLYLLAFQQEENVLYWQNGIIEAATVGISQFPTRAELNGKNLENWQTRDNALIVWEVGPGGNLIAWGKEIVTYDRELLDQLDLELEPQSFFWSPNGDMLLIQACAENGCSEKITYYLWLSETHQLQRLLINSATMQSNNPLLGNSKIEWAVWSPDQTRILLRFADDEPDVDVSLYQMLTLETMKVSPIFQELHLNDNLFISVQWLQDSQ